MDPQAGMKLKNVRVVNVTAVDFAAYLEAHLLGKERRPGSLAVLRMDIEGGEYVLLPYLLQPRGARPPVVCQLDMLVIEFHAKRVPPYKVQQHKALREQLQGFCPRLRVVLDPSNYVELPWKRSWPRPKEWAHIPNIDPYATDKAVG